MQLCCKLSFSTTRQFSLLIYVVCNTVSIVAETKMPPLHADAIRKYFLYVGREHKEANTHICRILSFTLDTKNRQLQLARALVLP